MIQTEKALRSYQERSVNLAISRFAQGMRRVIFQMATGGGKSPCFATMAHRFTLKMKTRVLILVHREELLQQARKTLFNWYDITSASLTAETDYLANYQVVVAMVETAFNRLKKNPNYFGEVGLMIVDETHRGEFKKLYPLFPKALICGFSATPISGKKDDPLKDHFDDIVCSIDIPELIEIWKEDHTQGLVPNKTICMSSVDRSKLSIKGGEFVDREMQDEYKKAKHVQNCFHAYKTYCDGKKTIIFNTGLEHNQKVFETFEAFGYPVRMVDGTTERNARKAIFKWFKETPGAILVNFDIATTGNDEPSVEAVMTNFSTQSLTKWLQTTGRGGRPYPGKEKFLIIDLGGNAVEHGDWSDPRDWKDIFFHPEKAKKKGEPVAKECKNCHSLMKIGATLCPECGTENKEKRINVYDDGPAKFKDFSGKELPMVDIEAVIIETMTYKPFFALHKIKNAIVSHVKYKWRIRRGQMTDEIGIQILNHYNQMVLLWLEIGKEKFNRWPDKNGDAWIRNGAWHQRLARQWMMEELDKQFEWKPSKVD
jgi:superfamily II DNA or RNA helicase